MATVTAVAAGAWGGMTGAAVAVPGRLPSVTDWADVYVEFLVKVADPSPLPATVLLNDPCDNFTAAPWVTSGSAAINAGGHTGNGFLLPLASSTAIQYNIPSGSQTDTLTVGCWVKFTGFPSIADSFLTLSSDAGATHHLTVKTYEAVSALMVYKGDSIANLILTSALGSGFALNTWMYIEVSAVLHDTTGSVTLNFNGTTVGTFNGDTKNGGTKTVFDQVMFNPGGGTGGTFIVDDIYIRNDSTFGVPTSLPIAPLTPLLLERILIERNHLGSYFDGSTVTGGFLFGTPSVTDYRWEGAPDASRSLYANEYERTNGIVDALLFDAFPINEAAKYTILSYKGVHGVTDFASTRWGQSTWGRGLWS